MADMITPRSSHCLLYMNGYIYAIGGVTNKSVFTKKCERYNPNKDEWRPIGELRKNAVASCCCSFNDRYIFKFGGILSHEQLNRYIEMYNVSTNTWQLVDPNI